ncbi:MAG: type III-B CRISPR-associated protein Cas10/Cmr2 [Aestuariivita sp.]|nr:type III-B CRISPR-associated protein Cas10/Cmr2 [Aestuariivita sp.]
MFEIDWKMLLQVWLHWPIDKALNEQNYIKRAQRYAEAAVGTINNQTSDTSDKLLCNTLSEVIEEIPPIVMDGFDSTLTDNESNGLWTVHPLSAQEKILPYLSVNEELVINAIDRIVKKEKKSPKSLFFAIWRNLADELDFPLNTLPADSRFPNYPLINYSDIKAGVWASTANESSDRAFLSFALSPVQHFIASARTLRDLWTGSVILSCIAFAAMRPILQNLGPSAIVYPSLRGNPLMDNWLRNEIKLTNLLQKHDKINRNPSIPHRFLALVPWGNEGQLANDIAERCKKAARDEWLKISEIVRSRLSEKTSITFEGWDNAWINQIADVFDFHTTVVPASQLPEKKIINLLGGKSFTDIFPRANKIREFVEAIQQTNEGNHNSISVGQWQIQVDMSARIMQAERMIRHIPVAHKNNLSKNSPQKCSLLGTYEQMGPPDFSDAKSFWSDATENWQFNGVRLHEGERFSSIALTKRFAMPLYLAQHLGIEKNGGRFPDTATVAAANWLVECGINWQDEDEWNGRWLHENQTDLQRSGENLAPKDLQERLRPKLKERSVPTYYAILVMDGDDLGRWLSGELMPKLKSIIHPELRAWFEQSNDSRIKEGLKTPLSTGPVLYATVSNILGQFATTIAPKIVDKYSGTLIYSGGDDLLALLPVSQAVSCARSLRDAYQKGNNRDFSGMGEKATLSAGLAIVHYKEDLRLALSAARSAEAAAKKRHGKDSLALQFMRRSGEHSTAPIDWEGIEWFANLIKFFKDNVSNRWTYLLRSLLPVLSSSELPDELIELEIKRLCNRIDNNQSHHNTGDHQDFGLLISKYWQQYRKFRESRLSSNPDLNFGDILFDFTILCQGAAFISRGRDD